MGEQQQRDVRRGRLIPMHRAFAVLASMLYATSLLLARGVEPLVAGAHPSTDVVAEAAGGLQVERALLPPEAGLDAQTILQRAAARYPNMHTGRVADILRGPLLLSYSREILTPHSLLISHLLYTWPPERARLELRVMEGTGKDSISLLSETGGWLLVDGQRVEVNRRELQAKTTGYSLQSLLKVHLEFPDQVSTNFGADKVSYEGRQLDESNKMLHLIALTSSESRPHIVKIGIDAETFCLRKIFYRGAAGLSAFSYGDFRIAVPSLSLPYRIELTRSGTREEVVKIKQIEVLAQSPAEMLDPASTHPPARRGIYNAISTEK